jgi:hypothetical protein
VTVTADKEKVLPEPNCSDKEDDPLTIVFDDAANGRLDIRGTDLVYTPNPGYSGPDLFTYYAEEAEWGVQSDAAWMRMNVILPPVIKMPLPQPTPVPTPVAAPKDTTAPAIALKNASKKQAVAIALTTSENASATLTLTLDKATAKKLKLSRSVGTLKAALTPGTSTLKVKLSSKAAKAFKKLKRVKLAVTAVVVDAAGNRTTKTLSITLKT